MYCHICGKEIDSSSIFCCYCGSTIPHLSKQQIGYPIPQEKQIIQKIRNNKTFWNNIFQYKYIILPVLIMVSIIIDFSLREKTIDKTPPATMKEAAMPSREIEDERWDAENYIYANFKYGIAFNLTRDVSWQKVSGIAKHTIVKFLQPNSGLTMYANIYPLGEDIPTDDIWKMYSEYIKIYKEKVLPYVSNNNGVEVTELKHRKADICGKNAIKTEYNFILNDERYDGEKYASVEYVFLNNGSMFSVGASCSNEWIENFSDNGITLEFFLRSFHLTPTNNINK